MLRNVVTVLGSIAVLVIAIVLAEAPPVRALAAWIDAHEPQLLVTVAAVLAAGFLLFFIGIAKLLMDDGQPLRHTEVEGVARSVNLEARPVFTRASRYRLRGRAAGRAGSDSFSLRELKRAWRNGVVFREPVWRRRMVTTAGALLLVAGILGALIVIGPPWLKVLGAGASAFVFGKLCQGLARS